MQIVSSGDNLHEMTKPVLGENKKLSICRLLIFIHIFFSFLPSMLSVKFSAKPQIADN